MMTCRARHEPLPAPVVLDRTCMRGETAAWEPLRQRADRIARAFDLDESGRARGPQFELAKVDPNQRLEISPHHDVVTKPRGVVAKIGVGPAQNQPVRAARFPKLKAHDLPPGWKALRREMREHGPHEDVGVTVLAPQLEPLLAPDSESSDHRSKLRPRWRQVVRRAAAARVGTRFHDARLLEPPQPLAESSRRGAVQPFQDLVEVVAVAHELAHDQRRPAFGEDLRRARDGAELSISIHGAIMALAWDDASTDSVAPAPLIGLGGAPNSGYLPAPNTGLGEGHEDKDWNRRFRRDRRVRRGDGAAGVRRWQGPSEHGHRMEPDHAQQLRCSKRRAGRREPAGGRDRSRDL